MRYLMPLVFVCESIVLTCDNFLHPLSPMQLLGASAALVAGHALSKWCFDQM